MLLRQLRRLKKRVTSRGRGNDVCEPPVMHHDRIPVPEIDGRQVAGENLLRLDVVRAPPGCVFALGCVFEQGVEPGIGVVAAVGALREKSWWSRTRS